MNVHAPEQLWPFLLFVLLELIAPSSRAAACNPLAFGALGDGITDSTRAIQKAIDTCASRGGGTVQLSSVGAKSIYLTGPLILKSHIHLRIDKGVTLQGTNDHSRYLGAYINWVYRPGEA